MALKSAQVWTGNFITLDATGALAAASVGPAGALYVAGDSNAAAVTISGANPYKFSVTLPALTAGQSVGMYITATVSGIATGGFVAEDIGDTKRVSDLNDSAYAGTDTAGTTELLTRIPDADPGTVGGLPTVDASNYVAGIQGTLNTLDDLNDFDPSTESVTLAATQGAITWDQQKITASAASEGALHITNAGASGIGIYADGTDYGIEASGGVIGQYNTADGVNSSGQYNESLGMGGFGLRLVATNAVDPAWAEPGTEGDTLKTLSEQIDTAQDTLTKLDAMIEADGPDYRFDANALEEAPSGGTALNAQQVRDAMLLAATPPGTAAADSIDDKLDAIPTTGGGLTAQQTRDAMKLAPTAGAPAAGSIDKHLDDVLAVNGSVAISATTAASVAAGELAIRSYHSLTQAITSTSTSALNTATKLWLAIKADPGDADAVSIVFLEAAAGLTVLAGVTYATTAHGSLTVTGSSGAWVVTVRLDEVATGLLDGYAQRSLVAELKALIGSDDVSIWEGVASVSRGIVRTVS